jgi:ribosome-binding protein aMBF1 (putative translation factor)
MQSSFAQVNAKCTGTFAAWHTMHVAQKDLVAALRAYRRADDRLKQVRADLDEAIQGAIESGEWQIVDVAELTGWSRETIRKIATSKS